MSSVELRVSSVIPASPNRIFGAWMDERQHSAIAGTRIRIDPWIGGRVHGWDGAVFASHLRLETGRRIALAFRTREFPSDAPDSYVEITLEPAMGGTKVTITQKPVPPELEKSLETLWKKSYLESMKRFFGSPEAAREALRKASQSGLLEVSSLSAERRGPEPEPDQLFKSSPGTLPAATPREISERKKSQDSESLSGKSRVNAKSRTGEKRPLSTPLKAATIPRAAKKASDSMIQAPEPAKKVVEATEKAAKRAAKAVEKVVKKAVTAAKKATAPAKEALSMVKSRGAKARPSAASRPVAPRPAAAPAARPAATPAPAPKAEPAKKTAPVASKVEAPAVSAPAPSAAKGDAPAKKAPAKKAPAKKAAAKKVTQK